MSESKSPTGLCSANAWDEYARLYFQHMPSYVSIDGVLASPIIEELRQQLLTHWGWRYKNWVDNHLTNLHISELPLVEELAAELRERLPRVFFDKPFCEAWAILQNENAGLHPHADNGDVVFTLWLTPDEYNLNPASGGLVLWDVLRDEMSPYHQFASAPWCVDYANSQTRGNKIVVPYRFNRAVIFDGKIFHSTDQIFFDNTESRQARLSMTLQFGDVVAARRRVELSAME